MAKKREEIRLDEETINQEAPLVVIPSSDAEGKKSSYRHKETTPTTEELINCLRNEKIIVRYIPKLHGIWGDNPKHVFAGGMAENATKTFVVPRLTSGTYVNVLTNAEKAFLEDYMGLEFNALSVHNKNNNFWDCTNSEGINKVILSKADTILNLADPVDYIKYKILLANKNFICPSLKILQDMPKATYMYVLIGSNDETNQQRLSMSITMRCYKEFGKIEGDADTLRTIVELLEGRPLAANTKLEFLQARINDLIQKSGKLFLSIITDPMLKNKVLIKKAVTNGIISKRGDFYYLKSDNSPLCENGEDPTLNMAAKYLSNPKRQELLFTIQAKLN